MRKLTAALLLMLCLAVSACGPDRQLAPLRPDLDHPLWFVCEASGTRPHIDPEYQIDWGVVAAAPNVTEAVARAKGEVAKLIATVRTREGVVAGYVLDLEGKHFVCANNMQTLRDFYKSLPAPAPAASNENGGGPTR